MGTDGQEDFAADVPIHSGEEPVRVINDKLLREFRMMGVCAWCNRRFPEVDPAHIYSRGAGRVDIRCNIVNLCRKCHTTSGTANEGNGQHPNRQDLLEISAKREGMTPDEITETVFRIRRDTKCKVWVVDQTT